MYIVLYRWFICDRVDSYGARQFVWNCIRSVQSGRGEEAKAAQVPAESRKKSVQFLQSTYDNFWASGLDAIGTSSIGPARTPRENPS